MSMATKKLGRGLSRIIIPGIIVLSLLSGCDVLSMIQPYFPRDSQAGDMGNAVDAEPQVEQKVTTTPTTVPTEIGKVEVWLPPRFDPYDDTESALIFNGHIDAFRKRIPNAVVDFRVKAENGLNAIVDALSLTAQAAPDALPTIVLLSREDMIIAAEQGLIQPVGFYTQELENDDWYAIAREIGTYKGETYGLPFAVDALVMFTHDPQLSELYSPLSVMRQQSHEFIYTAGNSGSLLPYLLYQSAGGKFIDGNGQMILEEQSLDALFSELDIDRKQEIIPSNILEFETEQQVWEAFSSDLVDSTFGWYSSADADAPDALISFIPAMGLDPFTYADGWVWCLVHNEKADTDTNIDFIDHMVSAVFLNNWAGSTHFLPPRKSVDSRENTFVDQLMQSAHLPPDNLVREYSQEVLADGVKTILSGEGDPRVITTQVLEQLEEENNRE